MAMPLIMTTAGIPVENGPRVMAYAHHQMETAKKWAVSHAEMKTATSKGDSLMTDMGLRDREAWIGARLIHDTAGPRPFKNKPATYGFTVMGSRCTYEYHEDGWRLMLCHKRAIPAGQQAQCWIEPTDEQRRKSREGWVAGIISKLGWKA